MLDEKYLAKNIQQDNIYQQIVRMIIILKIRDKSIRRNWEFGTEIYTN